MVAARVMCSTRRICTASCKVEDKTVTTVVLKASTATKATPPDGADNMLSPKAAVEKVDVLPAHSGIDLTATQRPLPTLGYACLNCTLRHQKPTFFNNRTCRLATIMDPEKGIPFVSSLALQNCKDLLPMLQWNVAHGITLMRLSSEFFPWGNVHYRVCDLPDYEGIKSALAEAGKYARKNKHRLTSHPCEFVKLAGQTEDLVNKSIADLELHSEMFDLLGYDANVWKHYNKINIHVGGTYGDKDAALQRFAANFKRLSPSCQLRLTVENDDRASMFSVADLKELHEMTGRKIPIVFDFHHWRFCTGNQSPEEALQTAMSTWPKGIKPVVHWSESQGGKKAHAHSDYIGQTGRMDLFGLDAEVDVMIESKAKELSLLLYRDIVEHGNSGREEYFLSIDAIEEEATRAEALKAAGKPAALSPVPAVVLEGIEIIPCNDKRLHGRSQRRNKPQRKAAAVASNAAKADQDALSESDHTETPRKPKRGRPTRSVGDASSAPMATIHAAGSKDRSSALAQATSNSDAKTAVETNGAANASNKRVPSKATRVKAAAALADAEAAAAAGSVPSPMDAKTAVKAGDPKTRNDAKQPSSSAAAAKRKRAPSKAAQAKAAAAAVASATPGVDSASLLQEVKNTVVAGKQEMSANFDAPAAHVESATVKSRCTRGTSKEVKAKAAAALAEAESAAESAAYEVEPSNKAVTGHEVVPPTSANKQLPAKRKRHAVTNGTPPPPHHQPQLGDEPNVKPSAAESAINAPDGNGVAETRKKSQNRAVRSANLKAAAVSQTAATDSAGRQTRQSSKSGTKSGMQ